MAQTISAPLPHVPAEPSAREHARAERQAWSAQSVESRVSVLEARWEETVPTLATSLGVRAELRAVENRLIIWILGAAFSLLFAVLGIFLSGYNTINERFDSINSRFDSVNTQIHSVNARIDSVAAELRTEIRETNARMDARFEKMEARFEKMEARFERLDSKFDALMSELRSQRNDAR